MRYRSRQGPCYFIGFQLVIEMIKFRWLSIPLLLGACAPKPANQQSSIADTTQIAQPVSDSLKPIAEVLAEHTSAWMKLPGVTGTGEGLKDGKPAILIFVDSLTDSVRSQLPQTSEGYPVVIKETGIIRAR